MFARVRLLSFGCFIAICTAACTSPEDAEDESSEEEPNAVDAVDTSLSPQAGTRSEVILGEPTIKTCEYKCEKFCKKMASGHVVCGETCICVFN